MIAALHRPGRRRERAARDVIEAAAGFDHGLFADYAFALHRMARAAAVGDDPVPRPQLHRLRALILDPHVIGPDPAPPVQPRLLGPIAHPHAHAPPPRSRHLRAPQRTRP